MIRRDARHEIPRKRGPSLLPALIVVIVILSASSLAVLRIPSSNDALQADLFGIRTIPITLMYQHKDSGMVCTAGPPCAGGHPDPSHAWNHVAGVDGLFGTADDCPHCSAYSAPAAIAMIAEAHGRTGGFTRQDSVYDRSKLVAPEITGDNVIQTHGVGMFDSTDGWPTEIQDGLDWALGTGGGIIEHGPSNPMTDELLKQYITASQLVLWIDHGGWPTNQSAAYPSADNKTLQGHAKVIAGYDDKDTAGYGDDMCLVYDPWPEYTSRGVLPTNATLGPGDTFDPYWLPIRDVNMNETDDIYLVSTESIPEFSSVIVPTVGTILAVAVVRMFGFRKKDENE